MIWGSLKNKSSEKSLPRKMIYQGFNESDPVDLPELWFYFAIKEIQWLLAILH